MSIFMDLSNTHNLDFTSPRAKQHGKSTQKNKDSTQTSDRLTPQY